MSNIECCGCWACQSVCPVDAICMKEDEEGFLYPHIDKERCIECDCCKTVCAFNKNQKNDVDEQDIIVMKSKNDENRIKSSSGGVFYQLAKTMIEKGGVVYGVVYVDRMRVVHTKAETLQEVDKMRTSKYVQSSMEGIYKSILSDLSLNKKILFSGTPCQVDAVLSYLKMKGANTENFLTCDFVCHGVPSPSVWQKFVSFCEKKYKSKMSGYNFRYKSEECRWGEVNISTVFEDSTIINSNTVRVFPSFYFDGFITRPSCENCPYTSINRVADITMADAWGIEKSLPFFADYKGISFVLVNTEKGKKIYEQVKNEFYIEKVSLNMLNQPHLHKPCKPSGKRSMFWKYYKKYGLEFVAKKYTNYGFLHRNKNKLRGIFFKFLKLIRKLLRGA